MKLISIENILEKKKLKLLFSTKQFFEIYIILNGESGSAFFEFNTDSGPLG